MDVTYIMLFLTRYVKPIMIVNTLELRQNGRHFADDIFKCIFLNKNVWILITIPLKFIPKSSINNIPALVQIKAWRRPGDKPLSETMVASLLTHICVTRPQSAHNHSMPYSLCVPCGDDVIDDSQSLWDPDNCHVGRYKRFLCMFIIDLITGNCMDSRARNNIPCNLKIVH